MTGFLLGLIVGVLLTLYADNQKVRKSVNTNVKALAKMVFTKKKKPETVVTEAKEDDSAREKAA